MTTAQGTHRNDSKPKCSNGDCPRPSHAKGRCNACYVYWNSTGRERPERFYTRHLTTKRPSMNLRHIDVFTGLFDGEGSVLNRTIGSRTYLILTIGMTDLDALEKCKRRFGGTICKVKKRENRKQAWVWTLAISEYAYALCVAMWPELTERRQGQIAEAVKKWLACGTASRFTYKWTDDMSWIWDFVVKSDGEDGCWRGPNAPEPSGKGYSLVSVVRDGRQKKFLVHRITWHAANGRKPGRLANTCGDKSCCRPDHWRECPTTKPGAVLYERTPQEKRSA